MSSLWADECAYINAIDKLYKRVCARVARQLKVAKSDLEREEIMTAANKFWEQKGSEYKTRYGMETYC